MKGIGVLFWYFVYSGFFLEEGMFLRSIYLLFNLVCIYWNGVKFIGVCIFKCDDGERYYVVFWDGIFWVF